MQFKYSEAPQRSPEWLRLRIGKVTASGLGSWLAISKRDGKPLKARHDYERQLAYERAFNVSFSMFVTGAMQDGIDYEDTVRQNYVKQTGQTVKESGAFYNDVFVASPDGLVGEEGLVEIKVLQDNAFSDVLGGYIPTAHQWQMQGQMWASGRVWCDYVAANLNTKKFKVTRVLRDEHKIEIIKESLLDTAVESKIDTTDVFDLHLID